MVLSFKSRVSCIFSSCIYQSKNIISWYPLFFVSALQFEGLFIPMCSIQCLSWMSYVSRPCAPLNGYLSSNLKCPWYLSSSAWSTESAKTRKFTIFLFEFFYFSLSLTWVIRFYNRRVLNVKVFLYYSGRRIRDQVDFHFR